MLNAVVHLQGTVVVLPRHSGEGEATATVSKDPGPIVPEVKELLWGAGSFIVFAVLMRFFLFPKLKKGMDDRYRSIRNAHDSADAERAAARSELRQYEAQVAGIRAEAALVVESARQQVEGERQSRLAEVNARINEQRAAAQAHAEQQRAAASAQVQAAVTDVAAHAARLATGREPSAEALHRAVSEVMAR